MDAIEREVGLSGAIEVVDRRSWQAAGYGSDAVDRHVQWLAVDGAGGLNGELRGEVLVGVEFEETVEGVGVSHHGENDGVALIYRYLIDIGQVDAVGAGGDVIDDGELAGCLIGGVDVVEAAGDGEALWMRHREFHRSPSLIRCCS